MKYLSFAIFTFKNNVILANASITIVEKSLKWSVLNDKPIFYTKGL